MKRVPCHKMMISSRSHFKQQQDTSESEKTELKTLRSLFDQAKLDNRWRISQFFIFLFLQKYSSGVKITFEELLINLFSFSHLRGKMAELRGMWRQQVFFLIKIIILNVFSCFFVLESSFCRGTRIKMFF